jgi:hypothetical protein
MDIQGANIYLIGDRLHLVTSSARIMGMYSTGPVFSCATDNVTKIGTLALQALAESKPDLNPEWRPEKGRVLPILLATGLRSWSALMGKAKSVSVTRRDGSITVCSTENLGPRGGFGGKIVKLPSSADPAELGEVIMKAMALST